MSLDTDKKIENISEDTKQLVEAVENLQHTSDDEKLNTIIRALGGISSRLDTVMQEQASEKKNLSDIKIAMEGAKINNDYLFKMPVEKK